MKSANFVVGALVMMAATLATTAGTENDLIGVAAHTRSKEPVAAYIETVSPGNQINRTIKSDELPSTPRPNLTPARSSSSPFTSSNGLLHPNPTTTTDTHSSARYNEMESSSISTVTNSSSKSQPRQEQLIGLIATDRPPDDVTSIHSLLESETTSEVHTELPEKMTSTSQGEKMPMSILIQRESYKVAALTNSISSITTAISVTESTMLKTRNELIGSNSNDQKSIFQGARGSKIVKPSITSVLGKYAPYFEDAQEELNITARIRNTVYLDCAIGMLGNKTVTWIYRSSDEFRLLTVGRQPYSSDQRISLYFRYPTNWRLRILDATTRDSGVYECQVATYPPLVKRIHLSVTAPALTIMDDSGRIKSGERHLKAGSALRLRCEARDVSETHNETVIWTRGDELISEDISENRTIECLNDTEVQVVIRTIVIERATPLHAGNYSCVVPEKAKTTIAVHVLNGELPAAVHDGNGVSRSVMNLWLVYLTISYIFSR